MRLTGQRAEQQAKRHLERLGLKCLAENVHCRYGELDLVMTDAETLVFVEVKYRSTQGYGGAQGAITASKQGKLRRTADWYLQQHGLSTSPCRFDVVAIEGDEIHWLKNAF